MKVLKWARRILITLAILLVAAMLLPFLIPIDESGADPATLADPDGQFATIQGVSIYYLDRGPKDGTPVMLLHGFGGLTFSWRLNMDVLAAAGYRVVAFDRPPFGLSGKPREFDYTPGNYARIAAELMDQLGISSAVMVGHSAGGAVIANFALMYPERTQKLVFVAGAVGMIGGSSLIGPLVSFPPIERWARIGARAFVTPERYVELLGSASGDPNFVTDEIAAGYQRPLRLANWDLGFLGLVSDTGTDNQYTLDDLKNVQVPALLVWGADDTWVPLERGQLLHDTLPNDQLIVYAGQGHLPMETNADQFNADLMAFLSTPN